MYAAVFPDFEGRKPQARELVLIAVPVALNVAGRAAFFMLPEFKPVAMTILAGGLWRRNGLPRRRLTMLVSNMLFSQGCGRHGRCLPWAQSAGWREFCIASVLRRSNSVCAFSA